MRCWVSEVGSDLFGDGLSVMELLGGEVEDVTLLAGGEGNILSICLSWLVCGEGELADGIGIEAKRGDELLKDVLLSDDSGA